MTVITKKEMSFTEKEKEAARIVNDICDSICHTMDNDCKNCPLNGFCGEMEEFLLTVKDSWVSIESED